MKRSKDVEQTTKSETKSAYERALEREERAAAELAEYRKQLATIEARVAEDSTELEALQHLEAFARQKVQLAKRQADEAESAVIDAHAAYLVARGTDDETAKQDLHAAALQLCDATQKKLFTAERELADARAKREHERAAIEQRIQVDDATRHTLQRLIASLQREHERAHHGVGMARLAEICERYEALSVSIVQHKQAARSAEAERDVLEQEELAAIVAKWPELKRESAYVALTSDMGRARREVLISYLAHLTTLEKWHGHSEVDASSYAGFNDSLAQLLAAPQLDRTTFQCLFLPNVSTPALTELRRVRTAVQRMLQRALDLKGDDHNG